MLAPALIKITDASGQYSFVGVTDANNASALGTTDFYQSPSGLLLPGSAIANVPLTSTTPMQTNGGAIQVGTALNTSGYGIAILAITASTGPAWSGTITFEGQGPDGNWYPVAARSRGTGAVATTATAGGLYSINCRGLSAVRAHITAYTAGTITVIGQAQALGAAAADEVLQTETQLMGSIRTKSTIVTLAITDTSSHDYQLDLSGSDIVAFEANSTLDQDCTLILMEATSVQWWDVDNATGIFSQTVKSTGHPVLITENATGWQGLNVGAITSPIMRLQCSIAPTSGSVTVNLYKRNQGGVA